MLESHVIAGPLGAFFVGDTGFEPVTSSKSVIYFTPDNAVLLQSAKGP